MFNTKFEYHPSMTTKEAHIEFVYSGVCQIFCAPYILIIFFL